MRVESVSKYEDTKVLDCGYLISISYLRVVKDTIGSIAESEKEVESAARGMEYIIRWVGIVLQCTISVTINA